MAALKNLILNLFILFKSHLVTINNCGKNRRAILLFTLGVNAFILGNKTIAQTDVSFQSHASTSTVAVNETFEVFYTLENANGENFTPPNFKDFEVLSGPNYSSSVQFINGDVYKKEEYSFVLRPTRVGKFTIGSAQIKLPQKKLRSNEIQIQVLKGKNIENRENEELFVRIEPSSKSLYLGQQLVINYKVYTRVNIERYNFEKEATYNGFYAEEVERFFSPASTETINGETYTTKVIRRLSLFPLQTGNHTIQESDLNFLVSENSGFLFSRNMKNIKRKTESIQINVLPLPEGAPSSFSGAVGVFNFSAQIDKTQTEVGKGITIHYIISGNGDPKRTQPQQFISNDTFEYYKPEIVSDNTDDRYRDQIIQRLEIEYTLVPKKEGTFSFTPEFTYFNTDSSKYSTIYASPFMITVRKSSSEKTINHFETDSSSQILSLKKINSFRKRDSFYGSLIFWGLFILPIIFLGSIEVIMRIKKRSKTNIVNHPDILHDFLEHVEQLSNDIQASARDNIGKLNEYLKIYLKNKFDLSHNFTVSELENSLDGSSIDSALKNALIALIERLEYGAYSQSTVNNDLKPLIDESIEMVKRLDAAH